jgi:hypothetical protein
MVKLWVKIMGFLWVFYGFSMGFLWVFMGFLWVFYGFSMGFLWVFMGFLWVKLWAHKNKVNKRNKKKLNTP